MRRNELCHYGVKGMRWGIRKYRENKLNRAANWYEIHQRGYEKVQKMKNKKWYNHMQAKNLKAYASFQKKRVNKMFDKYGKKYHLVYSFIDGRYHLHDKEHYNRLQNSIDKAIKEGRSKPGDLTIVYDYSADDYVIETKDGDVFRSV